MKKTSALISAIMTLVLGLILLIWKEGVIGVGLTVLGIVLIVTAVLEFVKANWVSGIIKAVLGIAVLVIGWALYEIALLVIGIVLTVYGGLEIIKRIVAVVTNKTKDKIWTVIIGLIGPALCLVAGIFFLIGGAGTIINIAFIVGGILLIVNGILALVEAIASKN